MGKIWKAKELLSKAAITSASFTGGIGLSQEEQDRFLDFVVDESRLKDQTRIVRMNDSKVKIDKLNIGNEKPFVPGVAATDPGETVGIGTSQILLEASETVAVVRISDDSLEDNVEGDDFAEHVMRMVARAGSNQLESALLNGREDASPNSDFEGMNQLWDGWLKKAKDGGHVVDAGAAGFSDRFIDTEKFSALVKALPTKYRADKRNLRMYMADDIEQDYSDLLAERGTGLGDRAILGEIPLAYRRIALNTMGLMPTDFPKLATATAGDTTLDANEPIGETVISVASETDFVAGEYVTFDFGGSREETHQIQSVAAGQLTLETPLRFPQDSGTTAKESTPDASSVLLTDPRNLIWGIQRDITLETERQARLRATDWVVSMRMTANVENADAIGLLENLKVK